MRRVSVLLGGLLSLSIASTGASQTIPRFPADAIWNQDISTAPIDTNSGAMINASVAWGTGGTKFQVDFSMHVLSTAGHTYVTRSVVKESGYYGDCDSGLSIPLPTGGAIEGSTDYTCDLSNDCHLFVVDGNNLYESYQTTVDTNGINSLCAIKWRLDLDYPPGGRGEGCTSADAAGFPMAPLITGPDEVFAAMQVSNGDLGHALRFIMPNSRMRAGYYVHPASHNGSPSSTSAAAIPYGARLRLHPNFDISTFNGASQVVLRTLKKYGMFLSDGGSVPLTFDDGLFATRHWSDTNINFDSHSLYGVALTDFDVMPIGTPIAYDNNDPLADCVRNPTPSPPRYVPVTPARLLDTRSGATTVDGVEAGVGAIASGTALNLPTLGRGDVAASAVSAVVMNVTAVTPSAVGYITVWPAGTTPPLAANLNLNPPYTIPNLVIAKPGNSGQISAYNGTAAGATNVVADVQGYFTTSANYNAVSPMRILDTRAQQVTYDGAYQAIGAIASAQKLDMTILGRPGIPASGVSAVVVNVTPVSPSASGFLTVWPTGTTRPIAANVNLNRGLTIPNLVIAKVGGAGQISIYNGGGAATDVVADLQGWFPQTSEYAALVPARLMDTRPGQSTVDNVDAGTGALGGGGTFALSVLNRGGVPASGVGAVALNVTSVLPHGAGYLTLWPSGATRPLAANLNLNPGLTVPNLVIARVGPDGNVMIYNGGAAPTDIVVDVQGYFLTNP